jgi:hypothetical protein
MLRNNVRVTTKGKYAGSVATERTPLGVGVD